MVILNTAEAELDETLGELIVKSRHRLENDQMIAIRKSGASNNSKFPRIVGAVSLLLIQPCCVAVNDNELNSRGQLKTDEREKDTNEDMDTAACVLTDEIASKISMSLPASLSILPLPGISNIYNSCDIYNLDKVNKPGKEPPECFKMGNDNINLGYENNTKLTVNNSCRTSFQKECVPNNESEIDKNVCFEEDVVFVEHEDLESKYERETPKVLSQFKEQNNTSTQNDLLQDNLQVSNEASATCSNDIPSKARQNWSCELCGKEIPTFETIVQHVLDSHQSSEVDSAITCPLCSYSFNKDCMHDFLQHIRFHLKPKSSFESKEESLIQKNSVIDLSNIDCDRYTSEEHKESSSSSQGIEYQSSAIAVDDSLNIFETLSKKFEDGQKSMVDCDLSEIDPEVKGKLFCAICDQPVKGYREIINHNKEHGNSNQCPICQKHFSMRGSLLRHCFSHTKNKLFHCHICTAVFTRKDNLKRHIHKHDVYGPVINKQNRPSFLPNQSSVFKMKEKKNKLLKFNFAAPKQERLTSFKRNKVFFTKLPSSLMKPNQIWKNNSGMQNTSSTGSISSLHDQHGIIDNNTRIFSQEPCSQDTSVQASHGKPSMYFIDSDVQEDLIRNLEESPKKDVSSLETNTILNYNCSMCSISFMKLSSLKRHVVACHSERSLVRSDGGYHPEQTMPTQCQTQTDEISSGAQEGDGHTQESHFYNHNDKVIRNRYKPAGTGGFNYNEPRKKENHESLLNTYEPFELLDKDIIDIESLGHLPQVTPDKQIKEEVTIDQESFSVGTDELELSSQNDLNQDIQDNFTGCLATSIPSVSHSTESEQSMQPPLIKMSSLINRSNQNRRHRMLNSKLPICHFCGMYLESGAQIVQHGENHQDQFENSCTCTICLQVLCGRDSLHRHAHSHIGTSYDCYYCNACFSRKDNLKRHLKKVHNVGTTPNILQN